MAASLTGLDQQSQCGFVVNILRTSQFSHSDASRWSRKSSLVTMRQLLWACEKTHTEVADEYTMPHATGLKK